MLTPLGRPKCYTQCCGLCKLQSWQLVNEKTNIIRIIIDAYAEARYLTIYKKCQSLAMFQAVPSYLVQFSTLSSRLSVLSHSKAPVSSRTLEPTRRIVQNLIILYAFLLSFCHTLQLCNWALGLSISRVPGSESLRRCDSMLQEEEEQGVQITL